MAYGARLTIEDALPLAQLIWSQGLADPYSLLLPAGSYVMNGSDVDTPALCT